MILPRRCSLKNRKGRSVKICLSPHSLCWNQLHLPALIGQCTNGITGSRGGFRCAAQRHCHASGVDEPEPTRLSAFQIVQLGTGVIIGGRTAGLDIAICCCHSEGSMVIVAACFIMAAFSCRSTEGSLGTKAFCVDQIPLLE